MHKSALQGPPPLLCVYRLCALYFHAFAANAYLQMISDPDKINHNLVRFVIFVIHNALPVMYRFEVALMVKRHQRWTSSGFSL